MGKTYESVQSLVSPGQAEPPQFLQELLAAADIRINGDAPWDIVIHDTSLYRRVFTGGSLAFGEAYMDGLWDSPCLDEFFHRLLRIDADERLKGWARIRLLGEVLRERLFNHQSVRRAFQVGEQHYDLGNDVFVAM